ncbi:MAG: hypothetical protein ACK5W9_10825 [Bdellovibrionales bacterium]
MELKKKDSFTKFLDFKPSHPAQSGCLAHATFDTLIAGFDIGSDGYAVDHGSLKPEKFLHLWKTLYPNLTLMDKVRLCGLSELREKSSPFFVLNDYYGFNSQFQKISFLMTQIDPKFQTWLSEKSFGENELSTLIDFTILEVNQILDSAMVKKDSRQLAAQRFELVQELTGLGNSLDSLIHLDLETLKQLRYPVTHQRDEKFNSLVKNWPSKIRAKAQRRGDTVGFEVNFFISSSVGLEKMSEQQKKVAHEWNTNQNNQ